MKYVLIFCICVLIVLGFSVIKKYDNTLKEQYCAKQAHWHPDCNLE